MEVGSPEWIETSLARLDELEQERAEHEAALDEVKDPLTLKQHNEALSRLDDEIKTLYAQLEAVAEDDEDEDEDEAQADAQADAPTDTGAGEDEPSSPQPSAIAEPPAAAETPSPATAAPAAAAAAEAPSPAASDPLSAPAEPAADNPFGGGMDPAPIITDDDLKPKGGGAKWAFVGVIVAIVVGAVTRSVRGGLIALTANAIPMAAGVGLFGLLRLELSVLSAAVLVIGLGLVVDDTLHAMFRLARTRGRLQELPYGLITTSLILCAGFALFLGSSFVPVRILGAVMAAVLTVALLSDLTVVPWLYRTVGVASDSGGD